jgi:hypothetical protein
MYLNFLQLQMGHMTVELTNVQPIGPKKAGDMGHEIIQTQATF